MPIYHCRRPAGGIDCPRLRCSQNPFRSPAVPQFCRALLAMIASLSVLAPARAADFQAAENLRAELTWGVTSGWSAPLWAAYGLAVGYRAEAGSPIASLLQLDVNDAGAIARLAGLPLYTQSYRAEQNEADATPGYASTVEQK